MGSLGLVGGVGAGKLLSAAGSKSTAVGAAEADVGIKGPTGTSAWNSADGAYSGKLGGEYPTASPATWQMGEDNAGHAVLSGPKATATTGEVVATEATSANAQAALRAKLSGLQKAQETAAVTRTLPDGRFVTTHKRFLQGQKDLLGVLLSPRSLIPKRAVRGNGWKAMTMQEK